MKKIKKIFKYTVIAGLLFGIVGFLYSQRVVYQHETLIDTNKIDIAHITDTHFINSFNESLYEKVVTNINDEDVDVVVFTGDLFQVEEIDLELETGITELLSGLDCENKLAVLGNHDLRGTDKEVVVTRILENSGFTVLRNEDVTLIINEITYHFIGLDDFTLGMTNYEPILETTGNYDNNYVLSHEPDTFDRVSEYDVIAMFSGHSHGGQVRLPFIGHIIMVYGAQNYPEHYYIKNDTELFVSFGLGEAGIRVRFCNPRYVNFYSNS